jgi:hypothetical protein
MFFTCFFFMRFSALPGLMLFRLPKVSLTLRSTLRSQYGAARQEIDECPVLALGGFCDLRRQMIEKRLTLHAQALRRQPRGVSGLVHFSRQIGHLGLRAAAASRRPGLVRQG